MNAEKLFKNIIFLQVAIFISGIFYYSVIEPDLAEETYYTIDYLIIIYGFAYIFNLYLLYKFKPVARILLVILTIVSFVIILFYPSYYTYSSNFEVFLDTLGLMGDGALLALLFCSELSKKFDKN